MEYRVKLTGECYADERWEILGPFTRSVWAVSRKHALDKALRIGMALAWFVCRDDAGKAPSMNAEIVAPQEAV